MPGMQFPELPPSSLPSCMEKTRTAVTLVTQTAVTVCQFPAALKTLPHSLLRATPYEEGITVIPVLQQKNNSEMLTNWPVITQPVSDRTQLEINSSSEPAILASISSDSQDKCVPKTNILLWPSQSRRRAEGKDTWWKLLEVWRCSLRRC